MSRFLCGLVQRRRSLAFDPGMTQEDLAVLLGMHRATLVRPLHELKARDALVRFTKRRVEIGDVEKLKTLARSKTWYFKALFPAFHPRLPEVVNHPCLAGEKPVPCARII